MYTTRIILCQYILLHSKYLAFDKFKLLIQLKVRLLVPKEMMKYKYSEPEMLFMSWNKINIITKQDTFYSIYGVFLNEYRSFTTW